MRVNVCVLNQFHSTPVTFTLCTCPSCALYLQLYADVRLRRRNSLFEVFAKLAVFPARGLQCNALCLRILQNTTSCGLSVPR